MSNPAQRRPADSERKPLRGRRVASFEVLGLRADQELIRSLAKQLANGGPDSARIRSAVRETMSASQPNKGGILAALRRSPLVGADLDLERPAGPDRGIDL